MDVTRECIRRILKLREILLSFHSNCCLEPVSYAAVEEDCAGSFVIEVFGDLDKVGADVVLLHGCPQSCIPNPTKGLLEVYGLCTVKAGRKQERQRKRWEDNIRKCTDVEFGKSQKAVENSEKWRKLVAKSSVVPQQP